MNKYLGEQLPTLYLEHHKYPADFFQVSDNTLVILLPHNHPQTVVDFPTERILPFPVVPLQVVHLLSCYKHIVQKILPLTADRGHNGLSLSAMSPDSRLFDIPYHETVSLPVP